MSVIYVLDTETTGFDGYPNDVVVDIGIATADLKTGEVKDVYSSIVGYDISVWSKEKKKSWIFENSSLTLDEVAKAPPIKRVSNEVNEILKGHCVTSYNTGFDLNKFLYSEPWNLDGKIIECTDIMKAAMNVCRIQSPMHEGYKFPKLIEAYHKMCPDDPENLCGTQDHRALSDARVASHVLLSMHNEGLYDPERY